MLSSSKSQRITISSGGQTSSYRPRTLVPHSSMLDDLTGEGVAALRSGA